MQNEPHNNSTHLQMTAILERGGFLTGVCVLVTVFTATSLGAAAVEAVVETEARVEEEEEETTEGFPAVVVVTTGVEFTNTGSVEGIGFPSLVWSFTTFPWLTKRDTRRYNHLTILNPIPNPSGRFCSKTWQVKWNITWIHNRVTSTNESMSAAYSSLKQQQQIITEEEKKSHSYAYLLMFGPTDMGSIGVHSCTGDIT